MQANQLDTFTAQYVETLLWSEHIDDATWDDFSGEAQAQIIADCAKFQDRNWGMIDDDLSQAGHDFALTRNGHGAGFWDGDWDQDGEELTEESKVFGECTVEKFEEKLWIY